MRLTLVSYGSEGDTRPFVALSRGLLDAGHEVLLLAEGSSLATARALDVPAVALAGDLKSVLPLAAPRQPLSSRELLRAVRRSQQLINGHAEDWLRAIARHACDSDGVLYSSLAAYAGATVAHELGKPAVSLWLQPTTPTREFAAASLPPRYLPGWLNRLSYAVSPQALVRLCYGNATRAARDRVFGGTAAAPRAPLGTLYGFSRHLVPRPRDWPASVHVCGDWALAAPDWRPPAALAAFLDAGPPPLYVGFGAMASYFRGDALAAIAAAVAGRRALFYPGWSRITPDMLPPNFFFVGDTPHAWLLPRTAAVMHHGGAGTTHAAVRAGVPSVVMPVAVDQFFWAERLTARGVAPRYVRAGRIDAGTLRAMLDFTADPAVRDRARRLADELAGEHGVANAVAALEALLRTGSATQRR